MGNPLKWVAGKAAGFAKEALSFVGGSDFIKAGELIDAIVTTPTERAEAKAELARLELEHRRLDAQERQAQTDALTASDTGQVELNKMEAARGFTWRNGLGWVIVLAIAFEFVIGPYFLEGMFGMSIPQLAEGASGDLWALLFGMLGLGGLRSFEKGFAMRQTTLRRNGGH